MAQRLKDVLLVLLSVSTLGLMLVGFQDATPNQSKPVQEIRYTISTTGYPKEARDAIAKKNEAELERLSAAGLAVLAFGVSENGGRADLVILCK